MTSISSISAYFNASMLSGAQSTSGNTLTQPAQGDVFGSAFSLSLSDAGISALNGGSSDDSSSGGDEVDQLFKFINMLFNHAKKNGNNDDSASSAAQILGINTNSSDDSSTSPMENMLASGGPLPAFLKKVDGELHLDAAHQQALQDIATQFQDAQNTPDTVKSIAAALANAGIPETLPE